MALVTIEEASDILCASKSFFEDLLNKGQFATVEVDGHRLVESEVMIAFKTRIDARRRVALDELSVLAQEYNMGY